MLCKLRNQQLFEDNYQSPFNLSTVIVSKVRAFVNASNQIVVPSRTNRDRHEVIWRVPDHPWIKVNTDGSSLGALGDSGASGLFCNSAGFPRGAFTFSVGHEYAFFAELYTAMYAVQIAWNKGWTSLWLECDS